MKEENEMKRFDAVNVPLKGSNLVEAGAGTGKTYSMAIIFLRLLVEHMIPVQEILVVTFTRAATAEIRDRTRRFIREALKVWDGEESEDNTIVELVNKFRVDPEAEQRRHMLREAVLWLDESSIFTIHGFCQRLLGDNAFETGTLYNTELVTDDSDIVKEAVLDFYRTNVSTLPPSVYALIKKQTGIDLFLSDSRRSNAYLLLNIDYPRGAVVEELKALWADFALEWERSGEAVMELLRSSSDIKRNADNFKQEALDGLFERVKSSIINDVPDPELIQKLSSSNIEDETKKDKTPPDTAFFRLCQRINDESGRLAKQLRGRMLEYVRKELPVRKRARNVRAFNDLLTALHGAVTGPGADSFCGMIRSRFRAALIDEFQDTDSMQYSVFRRIFGCGDSILFFIGDPKQSIYSFRGADIFSYISAAADAERRYTLSTNFRSEKGMVEALNQIFSVDNPFGYESIAYHPLDPAGRADEKPLEILGHRRKPMVIWDFSGDEPVSRSYVEGDIAKAAASEIFSLVTGEAEIGGRKVTPGDIAVIVPRNSDAAKIRAALDRYLVPSVMSSSSSVFNSEEAVELYTVLSAFAYPAKLSFLKAAVMSSLIGGDVNDIVRINDSEDCREQRLDSFSGLNRAWKQWGFMRMFRQFIREYEVMERLGRRSAGERAIVNILHLGEIIHRNVSPYSPEDALKWLSGRIAEVKRGSGVDEEYEQRLESEADAVTIITVHKSKGLQYPIVFCPYVWSDVSKSSLKDPLYHDGKEYRLCLDDPGEDVCREAALQQRAELLRLFYVSLTRAVNRCYLAWGTLKDRQSNNLSMSAPAYYLDDMKRRFSDSAVVEIKRMPAPVEGEFRSENSHQEYSALQFKGSIESCWHITSFSTITAGKHGRMSAPETELHEDVIDLPAGAATGSALHEIFENISFSDVEFEEIISQKLSSYGILADDGQISQVDGMIRRVLSAPMPGDGNLRLADISSDNMLAEMKFFFPLGKIKEGNFAYLDESVEVSEIEGFMTGAIDLVFRHNGKFYILDWKSNWLGGAFSDYSSERMDEAMSVNRYRLQYMIYIAALNAHLANVYPAYSYERDFGGVYYVFLRGVSQDGRTGIYYHRPSVDEAVRFTEALNLR